MFDTQKFGLALSKLRKQANMTQSELADKLNVTRQAISRYEVGDSFPDVSILLIIANIFSISLDELVAFGEPTYVEAKILTDTAEGREPSAESISDIINLAPHLKPSVLDKLSKTLSLKGIDISNIVELAEYLNDESTVEMLKNAESGGLDSELLAKLVPVLDQNAKEQIISMIFDGEMDFRILKYILPTMMYIQPQIEAAVIAGVLPYEVLDILREERGF